MGRKGKSVRRKEGEEKSFKINQNVKNIKGKKQGKGVWGSERREKGKEALKRAVINEPNKGQVREHNHSMSLQGFLHLLREQMKHF